MTPEQLALIHHWRSVSPEAAELMKGKTFGQCWDIAVRFQKQDDNLWSAFQ